MSRYENYEIKNNVFWTIWTPISSLATTVQLETGQWARFAVGMLWTLEHIEDNVVKKREIVLITNISWDSLTIVRKFAQCPSNDDANTQWQVSFNFDAGDTISAYIDKEHFTQISKSINDLMDNWNDRLRVSWTGWLNIKITEWNARVWTAEIYYAWWTATLIDNATNYVELTGAGTINVSTIGWDTKFCKLAKITTANGAITNIEHWKMDTVGGVMSASAGFKNVSNCVYNARWELIQFIADSVQYNLTYEKWALKTISFGEALYTMTYSNGRLVSVVES